MSMNSQTRIIVATAAALAVVDIAVRLIPMGHNNPVVGTSSNGVVTAQEFRLTDQWGNERATVGLDANGEPGIKLFDRFGTERMQIDTFDNTPSVIYMDKNGQRRSYYGMDNDSGNSSIELYGDNEETLTSLTTDGSMGHLTFSGANGNTQEFGGNGTTTESSNTVTFSNSGN